MIASLASGDFVAVWSEYTDALYTEMKRRHEITQ